MLYLLAAIIGSSSLVIILKLFDLKGVSLPVGITVNYLTGALLAFLFSPARSLFADMFTFQWTWIGIIIGAMFCLSFFVYALSAQRSGVAVTTICGRAAVVIPVVFAFAVLGAEPTALKISLLALIMLSMFMILRKKGGDPQMQPSLSQVSPVSKRERWLWLLPVAVFLFNGVNDTFVQYMQNRLMPREHYDAGIATIFLAGALTGLICYGVVCMVRPHYPSWKDLRWGALLGTMNWICMTGLFNGLDYVDGSVFYPVYYTGAIVISAVAGVWVFREKLSRLNYAGLAMAVIAIAVLSIL